MSDILIKNMDKPKSCFDCRFDCIQRSEDGNEHFCFVTRSFIAKHSFSESMKNFVLGNCPLVEVKPHGRCIDADEAYETMLYEMCGTGYQDKACYILKSEYYTPTILEASNGSDN